MDDAVYDAMAKLGVSKNARGYSVKELPLAERQALYASAVAAFKKGGFERVVDMKWNICVYHNGYTLTMSVPTNLYTLTMSVPTNLTPLLSVTISEKNERGKYTHAWKDSTWNTRDDILLEEADFGKAIAVLQSWPRSPYADAKGNGKKEWDRSKMVTHGFAEPTQVIAPRTGHNFTQLELQKNSTCLAVIMRGIVTISADLRVNDGIEKPGAEIWYHLDVRALHGALGTMQEFKSFDVIYNGEEWSALANRSHFFRVVPEKTHDFTTADKGLWDNLVAEYVARL